MIGTFGTLSKACSGLAAGLDSMVSCSIMTSTVITHGVLSLTFEAMDMTAFWAIAYALCNNSCSYFMSCLVRLPTSLLVRQVIAEVS